MFVFPPQKIGASSPVLDIVQKYQYDRSKMASEISYFPYWPCDEADNLLSNRDFEYRGNIFIYLPFFMARVMDEAITFCYHWHILSVGLLSRNIIRKDSSKCKVSQGILSGLLGCCGGYCRLNYLNFYTVV